MVKRRQVHPLQLANGLSVSSPTHRLERWATARASSTVQWRRCAYMRMPYFQDWAHIYGLRISVCAHAVLPFEAGICSWNSSTEDGSVWIFCHVLAAMNTCLSSFNYAVFIQTTTMELNFMLQGYTQGKDQCFVWWLDHTKNEGSN
jgi:hypothetical protein